MDLEHLTSDELAALEASLIAERQRRIEVEQLNEKANTLSLVYHQQVPAETQQGLPVWVKPLAPVMGYYSGAVVFHRDQGWQNDQPGVNMTEPGAEESTWTSFEDSGTGYPVAA
jgi:hypothetical protein